MGVLKLQTAPVQGYKELLGGEDNCIPLFRRRLAAYCSASEGGGSSAQAQKVFPSVSQARAITSVDTKSGFYSFCWSSVFLQ